MRTGDVGSSTVMASASEEVVGDIGRRADEHLLELVDHEQHAVPVGCEAPADAPQDAALAVPQLIEQRHRRVDGDPEEGGLQRLERVVPRHHRGDVNQSEEPGTAPALSAGTSPARTTDDLPDPDGPTTRRIGTGSVPPSSGRAAR